MRRCSVALLSLAGFLVMAHALGQEPESDAVTQMARQRFEEGVKLFDRGDYKGAQAAFLQAWTLKQHPAVLLNLAQSELRSGDHVAAARHFATYLRDYPDTPAKERAAAQQGLTEARKHTGQLEIMADDTNVEVLINNESVGRTPLPGPVDIAPGSYQIVGRLAGSEPFESSGSVQAGQSKSVEITFHQLAPPPPPPVRPPPPSESSDRQPFLTWAQTDPIAWTTLGAAGLGIGIGTIFAVLAKSKANDANSIASQISAVAQSDPGMSNYEGYNRRSDPCAPPVPVTPDTDFRPACSQLQDELDTLDSRKTMMWVGFGVGAVGVVGTGVAYYLRSDKTNANTAALIDNTVVSPVWSNHLGGIRITGTF